MFICNAKYNSSIAFSNYFCTTLLKSSQFFVLRCSILLMFSKSFRCNSFSPNRRTIKSYKQVPCTHTEVLVKFAGTTIYSLIIIYTFTASITHKISGRITELLFYSHRRRLPRGPLTLFDPYLAHWRETYDLNCIIVYAIWLSRSLVSASMCESRMTSLKIPNKQSYSSSSSPNLSLTLWTILRELTFTNI